MASQVQRLGQGGDLPNHSAESMPEPQKVETLGVWTLNSFLEDNPF